MKRVKLPRDVARLSVATEWRPFWEYDWMLWVFYSAYCEVGEILCEK